MNQDLTVEKKEQRMTNSDEPCWPTSLTESGFVSSKTASKKCGTPKKIKQTRNKTMFTYFACVANNCNVFFVGVLHVSRFGDRGTTAKGTDEYHPFRGVPRV